MKNWLFDLPAGGTCKINPSEVKYYAPLPDGTIVYLSSGKKILVKNRYHESFKQRTPRGYFKVTPSVQLIQENKAYLAGEKAKIEPAPGEKTATHAKRRYRPIKTDASQ